MPNHQTGRAAPKSGPDGGVFPARNTHSYSANRRHKQHLRRPPITTRIMAALTEALADLEPGDRSQILEWTVSRGLLGLAHERGFAAAAETAYRYGDQMAVAQ